MLKLFLRMTAGIMCVGFVGVANASLISTGPSSYGTASHSTSQWQRLGYTDANDGVTWSINGGEFGNVTNIFEGDQVVFKFDVYKEYWGTHSFDALKVWVDQNQNGSYTDESVFLQDGIYFNKDNPFVSGQQSWYIDDNWETAWRYQNPVTGVNYGGPDRLLAKTDYFFTSAAITAKEGFLNLRARVTCSDDLCGPGKQSFPTVPTNWDRLQATGYIWQGDVEDYQITVSKHDVPEPGTLSLMFLGLTSLGGAFFIRKRK